MRPASRLVVAAVTIVCVAAVANSASANHFTTDPIPGRPHQHVPSPAVAEPDVPCVISGEFTPGTPGGRAHQPLNTGGDIPGYQARHSHYNLIQTIFACLDFPTGTGMTANGGDDGHFVDPEDPLGSVWHHQTDPGSGGHHGTTRESGWSHCSNYSGDIDNSCNDSTDEIVTDAESNVCEASADKGKGDIELPGPELGDAGWVKYIRVGVVMYVWGCFDSVVSLVIRDSPHFSSVLAIHPPAVLTGGVIGNPAFPLCLVPGDPVVNTMPESCGYSLVGILWRGDRWLVDFAAAGGATDYLHCVDQNLPTAWLPPGGCAPLPPDLN